MLLHAGVYLCVTTLMFQTVQQFQPTPFIDEIFHIPQAQRYCNGSFFEWDNKITTLPGLYIASFIFTTPLKFLFQSASCDVWHLRYINVLFNLVNIVLNYKIIKKLDTGKDSEKTSKTAQVSALTIGLFPVLHFFSFLYYTDPGSVMFVLATYLASLHGADKFASILGVISIIFRQTNIVWVVFVAGVKAAHYLSDNAEISKIQVSPDLKDKLARFLASLVGALVRYLLVLENIRQIAILLLPYGSVAFGFLAFVYLNNGIVVGDRSSHTAVFHLSQLLYCSLFILFFASPLLISSSKIKRFFDFMKKQTPLTVMLLVAFLYVLVHHSHVHPYLLADNRHYAFYVWRRFLGHPLLRFLFVPVYLYAMWSINDSLSTSGRTALWRIVYLICTAAVTVPQSLLEFRYFVIPYLFFRLNVKLRSGSIAFIEFLFFCAINLATFLVFTRKTVHWSDLAEPQRIIW